jgi:ubiquitin-conjugating enzyme E2 Z
MDKKTFLVRKETITRIINDVKEIKLNPLHQQNIYYHHDEDNILNGYALIIGPKDTPYENGYYFFNFFFPCDFPYSPPLVKYLTNDGITRFHPNFYRNGKCCLSILNTWKGDEWTSCLTISSVLLSLCILFTNDPLLHEPGINKNHHEINLYNEVIEYKNYSVSILNTVQNKCYLYNVFSDVIKNHFNENKQVIINNLEKKQKQYEGKKTIVINISVYEMKGIVINYPLLIKNIKKIEIK